MLRIFSLVTFAIFTCNTWLISVTPSLAGGDGGCIGGTICRSGTKASLECTSNNDCPGSSCEPVLCFPDLPRLCEGGTHGGNPCSRDADCAGGECRIQFQPSAPAIHGVLTIIVHDEAITSGPEPCRRAATVLLEVKQHGQQYVLAQSYGCIPQTSGADVDFLRTEGGLDIAVRGIAPSLLTRLLFQGEDLAAGNPLLGSHFSRALRNIFGIAGGHAIISKTPTMLKPSEYTDTAASPLFEPNLASVVRLKIDIKFVQD